MRGAVLTLLLCLALQPAAAAPETCNGFKSCSRTFHGAGLCDGKDQLAILQRAWEARPITITKVNIALMTWPPSQLAYAMAGNGYQPDLMAKQIGPGATTEDFPPGRTFSLPAKGTVAIDHVDAHVSCTPQARLLWRLFFPDPGARSYQVWLTVFYTLD